MKRKGNLAGLMAVLVVFGYSIAFTAKEPPQKTTFNPLIHKIVDYAMPESRIVQLNSFGENVQQHQKSLGGRSISTSPGTIIGDTYYDYQHNNTTGRMIEIGRNIDGSDTTVFVHYAWMDLFFPQGRGPEYNYSGVATGLTTSEFIVPKIPGEGGYVNLDVTPDNRAVISGHYGPIGYTFDYSPTVWYDSAATAANFTYVATLPDTLWQWANPYSGDAARTIWPHLAFQQMPDGSHVTHLTGVTMSEGLGPHILYYYRKHGDSTDLSLGGISSCPMLGDPNWDCPWVYDTAWASVALVTASKKSSKVALVWTANRPDYNATPGCDTCSNNNSLGVLLTRHDNDVYYQLSNNYGVTWNP